MLLERIYILLSGIAVATVLFLLWQRYSQYRLSRLMDATVPESVRKLVAGDRPAILYFTTRECAQCRFQQTPILENLVQRRQISVYTLDAVDQDDLAKFYGVMTVPSTVLLSPQLQPVAVNHGLATPDRLAQQIESFHV